MGSPDSHVLGAGVYTLPDAARLVDLPSATIRRWVDGYSFKGRDGGRSHSFPVLHRDFPELEGEVVLSFADLVEVLFVKAFLEEGVSMAGIRSAAKVACEIFESKHPFNLKRFTTDGQSIFARLQMAGAEESVLDLARRQGVFREVIRPYLRQIEYDAQNVARLWHPMPGVPVLIDPRRSFGQPIVPEGVPTRALFGAHRSGENDDAIARWYDVQRRSVSAAIQFESEMESRMAA